MGWATMTDRQQAEVDISVVVPTHNRADLLVRLLRQLGRLDDDQPESRLTYEVVVVDEASSDTTPAALASLGDRLAPHVSLRVIRHDRPTGPSGARNAGIRDAVGAAVAWIDDDDLTSTDRLRRQHEALCSGARWSAAAKVDIDDDLRVVGHARCPPAVGFLPSLLRSNVLPAAGQGLLVARDLLDEVGLFDESLGWAEDWELCIRLAANCTPHLLDVPLVGYRTGAASLSTDTDRMARGVADLTAKHGDLYATHGVTPDWASVHRSLLPTDAAMSRRRGLRRAGLAIRSDRSISAAARLAAVVATPERFATRSARVRREQVPDAWATEARAWLDQV